MNKEVVDELFDVKTAFYLGNYQLAINEAQKLKLNNANFQIEKDTLMYRSFLAQKKYNIILDEIKPSSPEELKYIRLMAEYLSSSDSKKNTLIDELDAKLGSLNATSSLQLLLIANIFVAHESYETALKVLYNADSAQFLECSALAIQIYIKLDRYDLAKKELAKLVEIDEDSVITQLASAWVYMATGEKLQDAYFTFQELADKNTSTSLLLNCQGLCLINQGKYEDALPILQEALEKDSNNPDVMVNMIVLCQHLGKPVEITNRYISQLKDSFKSHPFVRDLIRRENDFERCSQLFRASVPTN